MFQTASIICTLYLQTSVIALLFTVELIAVSTTACVDEAGTPVPVSAVVPHDVVSSATSLSVHRHIIRTYTSFLSSVRILFTLLIFSHSLF